MLSCSFSSYNLTSNKQMGILFRARARLRQVTGLFVKIRCLPAAVWQAYKELREVAFVRRQTGRIQSPHYHYYPSRERS